MNMHIRNLAWTGLLVGAMSMPCAGQAQTADPQPIDALRQELAELKLAMQKTQQELEDLRDFLAEEDVEARLAEWRTEREGLLEQRRLLQMEKTSLETARRELHQETYRQAQDSAAEADAQRRAELEASEPRWSAQYMLGLIEENKPTVYLTSVSNTRDYVLTEDYPGIDRRNVMVRGTFQNKSLESWRYTFEIRVAGNDGPVMGDITQLLGIWRYQTPVLGPGDLHNFEVKIPVTDARDIEIVQITTVTADRPAMPAVQSPMENQVVPPNPPD